MAKETDQFLQAEESAEKLVKTLQDLQVKINSYKTAADELNIVRERLINFIQTTEVIARDTHEAVKTVKEIGGPKILKAVEDVSRYAKVEAEANVQKFSQLRTLSGICIAVSLLSLIGVIILLLKHVSAF